MYGLTAEDIRIQETARAFVDSLIPYEVEAELAGGYLPRNSPINTTIARSSWGCMPPICPHRWEVPDSLHCNRFWYRNKPVAPPTRWPG